MSTSSYAPELEPGSPVFGAGVVDGTFLAELLAWPACFCGVWAVALTTGPVGPSNPAGAAGGIVFSRAVSVPVSAWCASGPNPVPCAACTENPTGAAIGSIIWSALSLIVGCQSTSN